MEKRQDKDGEGESLCRPFLYTILVGTTLAGIAAAVVVIILVGIPALKQPSLEPSNCTTMRHQPIGDRSCLYDCGNEFNQRCSRIFPCSVVWVQVHGEQRVAKLAWDVEHGQSSSECSNYPHCDYQGIDERYRFIGMTFSCYVDRDKPDVAFLVEPASALPYVLWPSVAIAYILVMYAVVWCWRRRKSNRAVTVERDEKKQVVDF
eukprot:m.306726 g.306726  ORF g.306726 m.306726 type:complete len:205 (+) comp41535_c0_seq1:521-1135(+)